MDAALLAAQNERKNKKEEKVFGGRSRKPKNTGPSEVDLAMQQLEALVSEKYSKVPQPTDLSAIMKSGPGHGGLGAIGEKPEKVDKNSSSQIATLPVYVSNLVTLYRGMVEMEATLARSERERSPSPTTQELAEIERKGRIKSPKKGKKAGRQSVMR